MRALGDEERESVHLTAEQLRVETELFALCAQSEEMWAQYCQLAETHRGTVINIDLFRDLHPAYAAPGPDRRERRTRLTPATYRPAKKASREWYDRLIAESEPGSVLFTGGGPASGKTRSLSQVFGSYRDAFDRILDTSLTNLVEARTQIEHASAYGHAVKVVWVYRPFHLAVHSMIERACTDGRFITLARMAFLHRGSKEAFLALGHQYCGSQAVTVQCIINAFEEDDSGERSLEAAIPLVISDLTRTTEHVARHAFEQYCQCHTVPEDLATYLLS